ncbi:hypothetical protein CPIN18021_0475 [Campylobacter pinnipediorum subsp. caledonicus]|uniref:Uncharacterized protein n=1 Tax=Campylobacter pinnipediorum subsp. caledonicus TaxID=1874362 RepID=A0A1S6U6D5_9BACT|nr:hypothetical protein [Campylobacter pinnipediorum]AQW85703.1 hypothetical protein CPIN18020_0470 [Campylobacter pinnipediorum subsp. caledonicus]AQW87314.1 hypothetical protein CPIN18021_0475 [Campylobacter pinnipediorum subsp. caledonicus]OPA72469.1 hypothetical protein BB381_06165 [Campylobacter pinnipediorum subsp. caledonicus]
MNKIIIFFCCFVFCFATEPDFDHSYVFELPKDEWGRVAIIQKQTNEKDYFDFRWTLFDTTNITVQSFFRRFPRHMVMGLQHGRDRYKQDILPSMKNPPDDGVKLYITFIDFKNNLGSFQIDILDGQKLVDVEFIRPKTRR